MNTPDTQKDNKQRKRRTYRRITPETVAIHKAATIAHGNGAKAVRENNPEYDDEYTRAYRIARKSESMMTSEYIENSLQQIGAEAVQELGELIHSEDQRIRTKNVHYAIDHIRGKAVQKSINANVNVSIEDVLA